MPLTGKGQEIMGSMKKQYGGKKGEEVFYASKNKGKITGVDRFRDAVRDALRSGKSPRLAFADGAAVLDKLRAEDRSRRFLGDFKAARKAGKSARDALAASLR